MHKCIIARIDKVVPIEGADRIQKAYVLGECVIVSKELPVGYKGVLFPEGVQLSHEYCFQNNLYRHSEHNKDKSKAGFFSDNRRVRAQKFMKIQSDAYFADIGSLSFIGASVQSLKEGDQFDSLDGVEICRKWINPNTANKQSQQQKKKKAVETPFFHQHVDTDQFKYYASKIPVGAMLSFHAKVHGTSARYSNTLVEKQPEGWKSLLNKALLTVSGGRFRAFKDKAVYEKIAGTRRVVLYDTERDKVGYNGPEGWRFEWLDQLTPYLDEGITVYGEIVGYANGSPIMGRHSTEPLKSKEYKEKYGKEVVYKYGCPEGDNRFIIYRVTYTTASGKELDMTVDQLVHWASSRGFEHTLEVAPRMFYDGNEEALRELVEELTERPDVLTEDYDDPSHISEGIIIRVDHEGETPRFYKNKSWAFRVMEGIYKEEEIDLEDAS